MSSIETQNEEESLTDQQQLRYFLYNLDMQRGKNEEDEINEMKKMKKLKKDEKISDQIQ